MEFNYNIAIKIIIPRKFISEFTETICNKRELTIDSFFTIMTGSVVESLPKGVAHETKYMQISSKNGCYIYQLNLESNSKEKLETVFANKQFIDILKSINKFTAHNTICINNKNASLKTFEIQMGYDKEFSVKTSQKANTIVKRPHEESESAIPAAPKKARPTEIRSLDIDEYPSNMTIKFIIPENNQPQAHTIVNGLGFSSIENFFDALSKSIRADEKCVIYNEISRKNDAHVFIMEIYEKYDNFVYLFNKDLVSRYIEPISSCCADSIMHVFTPLRETNGSITYEKNPLYYIRIGRRSAFGYYMGEDSDDNKVSFENTRKLNKPTIIYDKIIDCNQSSIAYQDEDEEEDEDDFIQMSREEFGDNQPYTRFFTDSFNEENIAYESDSESESVSASASASDNALIIIKHESQRIRDTIHAKYEQHLSKLNELIIKRDTYISEIEITRRIIKELQEIV